MASQAAEFATHRPSYWQEVAAAASHDFLTYNAFVHGYVPAPPITLPCADCEGIGYEGTRRCRTCDGEGWFEHPGHHDIIVERLLFGNRLEMILGPPDTAKSTMGVCFAEWVLGRTPDYRWLIASEVASGVATTIVTQIGETIAQNERYRMVFGALQDPRGKGEWSTHSIRFRTYVSPRDAARQRQTATPAPPPWLLQPDPFRPSGVPAIRWQRGRSAGLAYPNVKAVGWRSGYTGLRADGIIADDLVSDRSSRSQATTEAVYRTLHQKMLARLSGGSHQRVLIFGQRWAPRDLYGLLLANACVVFDNNPQQEGMHVLHREEEAA